MKKHFGPSLLTFLFLIHVQGITCLEISTQNEFITRKGVQILMNGSPFHANGFNAYWLMYFGSDPSMQNKVSAAFEEAVSHGLAIARTWAFGDGGDSALQYSPGNYNEKMFKGLDFVISEAKKYGLRVILSLVNNYEDFGGKKQYVDWARSEGQNLTSDDDFFTNVVARGYYKDHIKAVLTRRNSITGVFYKDDPTIMAWELMNEPRCTTDTSGKTVQAWISEMASYLKSIDSNHLLEAGLEGFYGAQELQLNPNFQVGTDFIANNQIKDIDFATVHTYPDAWVIGQGEEAQLSFLNGWLRNHIQDAENILGMPLLFTEFGKSSRDSGFNLKQRDDLFNTVYSAIYSSASGGGAAAGGLYWQFLTQGMESLRDGYEIILSESPSTATIIAQQSQELKKIRKMSARIRNVEMRKNARDKNGGNL